jgi:hypothetical protein
MNFSEIMNGWMRIVRKRLGLLLMKLLVYLRIYRAATCVGLLLLVQQPLSARCIPGSVQGLLQLEPQLQISLMMKTMTMKHKPDASNAEVGMEVDGDSGGDGGDFNLDDDLLI